MILGAAWPDLIIMIVLVIAAFKGYAKGFVAELGGALAVVAALITPWFYNGAFDKQIAHYTKVGPGSAHVIGMFITGLLTYIVVLIIARVLSGVAKLPVLGFGNALAGAIVGLGKAAVLLWVILFIALFFPLSRDIRDSLRYSLLAPYLVTYYTPVDNEILTTIPWFARPIVMPYFRRHHL